MTAPMLRWFVTASASEHHSTYFRREGRQLTAAVDTRQANFSKWNHGANHLIDNLGRVGLETDRHLDLVQE
mgnify:CR=1 FL=1